LRIGALGKLPYLVRSLGSVLEGTGLPLPVKDAVGIWTHVAGQMMDQAPSPLAFVPAIIHTVGAYYPLAGIGAIPTALAAAAQKSGVEFSYGCKVTEITSERGLVTGVVISSAGTTESIPADVVVSDYNAIGTYTELLTDARPSVKSRLTKLPLQSPGVCAYLSVGGKAPRHYLHFLLPGGSGLCRLLVTPASIVPECEMNGRSPARLIAPMRYDEACRLGQSGQRDFLHHVLAERWWRDNMGEFRVLAVRTPSSWGDEFNLYRWSMNPVMTGRFMRAGRIAHRSADPRGLYLTGSSTHPGQWVSFCAISGILAADEVDNS
jgi:phytoene desaturase